MHHSSEKECHLNACTAMRNFAGLCGAETPELLRATNLRKHIATKGVTQHYTTSDMAHLADIMGYEDHIHEIYYRQSVPQLEIPEMARLLEAAMGPIEDNIEEEDRDEDYDDHYREADIDHGKTTCSLFFFHFTHCIYIYQKKYLFFKLFFR